MSDPIDALKAADERANGRAMASRAIINFLNWLNADVRTRDDLLRIREEAGAIAKESGGILFVRIMGHNIEEWSQGDIQTYIGIRIAGGGKSEDHAKKAYFSRIGRDKVPQSVEMFRSCTIKNPTGKSIVRDVPKMLADNTNKDYQRYLIEAAMRDNQFRMKNKMGSVVEEFLFMTYNEWGNYMWYAKQHARGGRN